MPVAALPLPILALAAGAAISRLAGRRFPVIAQPVAAAAIWVAAILLAAEWALLRAPLTASFLDLGDGARLAIRLDAAAFAVGILILVPVAMVTTFRRVTTPALIALTAAAGLLVIQAAGLLLAALALGLTLNLVALHLVLSGCERAPGFRVVADASWLAATWAGAALWGVAGTAQFAAIPLSALTAPIFTLVAIAAVLTAGLVPWRPWTAAMWERCGPATAAVPILLVPPLGFNLLLRVYEAGGGRYPSPAFNAGLAALGALVAIASGLRAQAAVTRVSLMAELVPAGSGFTLMALSLGTPLGVAAGLCSLAATSLLAVLLPLTSASDGSTFALLALAAGAPPTLVFAARLLAVQAALEGGATATLVAVAGTLAWILGLAASGRGLRLPPGPMVRPGGAAVAGFALAGLLLVAGGALVGVLLVAVAVPAAAAVTTVPGGAISALPAAVDTASGRWPAVALGGVGLVITVAVVAAARSWRPPPALNPAPYFGPVWAESANRIVSMANRLEVPAEFRVTNWQLLERALAAGRLWPWIAISAALAVILLR